MSLPAVLARIDQLQQALTGAPPAAAPPSSTSSSTSFASALAGTTGPSGPATVAASDAGTGDVASRLLAAARGEVGVTEQPPGSNDGPRIAEYRSAVPGGGVGPWCAYFVSWAAKQAGAPLGEVGQGFANVSAVSAWAQRTGRFVPSGSTPRPGDLVVWGGEHIGIVESVDPDGKVHTIEGNSSNAVSRRTYGPDVGGATGFVRLDAGTAAPAAVPAATAAVPATTPVLPGYGAGGLPGMTTPDPTSILGSPIVT